MRQIRLVTPDIAMELLKMARSDNMMFRQKIEKYKTMMLSGKWRNGIGDSIIIRNGKLLDGRHRLTAIIETGLSFKLPFDDCT
jgi:hypothetical protein